ncbi:MAG: hypothetical protein JW913_07485 [Chitinispirillaceae bacterium]|nr:hypothetical protein [Chitinispirillaceae bacterium]
MRTITRVILILLGVCHASCNFPYSEKLFPMEQFLQGGWYRIGSTADTCVDVRFLGTQMDTGTTIEVFFFSGNTWKQYYRQRDHIDLSIWRFLATDTSLYRSTDSIGGRTFDIVTSGDTLLIEKSPFYFWFCRYHSSRLPGSWPDSIVVIIQ